MNDHLHPICRDMVNSFLPKKPAGSGFPEGWDRDDTKTGMFVTHQCSRCSNGAKPCPSGQTGPHRNCEHPHARND